jgi:putative transposase
VAFVTDAYSRRVVGRQTSDHLRADLPLEALEMALWNRNAGDGKTVHYSDAGQYPSIRYTTGPSGVGVIPSIGGVADTTRDGRIAQRNVQSGTHPPARAVEDPRTDRDRIYEWISWCDNARIHTSTGDMSPIEYEHRYHAQTTTPASIGAT